MDVRPSDRPDVEETSASEESPRERRVREWWHRDHPTFTALSGFFSGLAYVAIVPALFAGILDLTFGERTAREAFPFVVLLLALPLLLLLSEQTKRFGKYMLVGMLVTALVVVGVAWAVAWMMLRQGA